MPQLSLTDFVDIVSKSGTSKATKVRQVKTRPAYDPAADFYKRIRDCIVETHENGKSKDYLNGLTATLADPKKLKTYPFVITGYKRWWGNKSFAWFAPPNMPFSAYGVDVSVNPELGLEVDGIPHLIKLYFKDEPLKKNKIDIITHLMSITCTQLCPTQCTKMSVLDVRCGRLISPTVPIPALNAILNAELAYVAALWSSI